MKEIKEIKNQVIDAIKASKSIDEAIEKIRDFGYEISKEEIEKLIKTNEKKVCLNDNQLAIITGGTQWYDQKIWLDKSKVEFLFKKGDKVEVASGFGFGTTVRCVIKDVGYGYFNLANGGNAYFDIYYCENEDYTWWFYDGWKSRDLIEKN